MTGDLVEVRLLALPVPLHLRATQHLDELQRELTYIASEADSVPGRLGELSREITTRFAASIIGPQAELDAAAASGREVLDLVYRIPAVAAPLARSANALLDEVHVFCKEGGLLALAAPRDVVRYRRWFFSQFAAQIDGEPPTPWPEWGLDEREAGMAEGPG
jgi:hypothetical protein